eukprot:CAMPEP_0202877564 /NCGR_PEP_ID=MMETSP1391-20130828/30861_1 /ASSEMBLY_ACC=CAM_ASM_000867 /TAXON_ID=1034604 /ORGANISM="Chlamydomonas leiostraca, Strain SAG 11-49" /LENGTH=400 /DNA_ID=CAMNT_0049559621 /DNA_START=89 /DNA_END=1291 /DNA_ORIENTATION=+
MCIAFFGAQLVPGSRFILAFNRDEFILRPTRHTHWWEDKPWVLAGRDSVGHGTWLGCSRHGRISFLTNLRAKDPNPDDPCAQHHISRGALTTGFLNTSRTPLEYLQGLDGAQYAGFNLVCVDASAAGSPAMAYTHNLASAGGPGAQQAAATQRVPVQLEPGRLYGISNGTLGEWTKVLSGIQCGEQLLQQCRQAEAPAGPDAGEAAGSSSSSSGHAGPSQMPWEELFSCLLGDSSKDEQLRPAGATVAPVCDAMRSGVMGTQPWSHHTSYQPSPEPENSVGGNASEASSGPATPCVDRSRAAGLEVTPWVLNVDDHLEYVASSRFITPVPSRYGPYGTRSQSVLVVWEDGHVEYRERYLDASGPGGDTEGGEVVVGYGGAGQDGPVWRQLVHTFVLEPKA